MSEQLSNLASSSLVSAISPTETSIVVHDATSFPNSGNFRILIDSELLLVTAVSGATFTVSRGAEGTTNNSHAENATVSAVLTAGGLTQYVSEHSGLTAVVQDTAPELGGNLNLNGHNIGSITPTQLSYLDATSSIQTQLNAKAATSSLATVATSGSYNDLSNKPSIPAAQVNSDWNAGSGVAQILNKPSLATVATSGSYNDLSGTPSLGTAAALNVGTSANNVVQMTGADKLPAVDGSLLTNMSKSQVGLGSVPNTDCTNAANISSGTLPAARLPNPSVSTLGGVQSKASTSHQFLTQIGTDGSVSAAQPSASDVSGLATSATTDTTNASNISSGTLAVARGGTGLGTTPTNGQVLIGNGTNYTLTTLTAGTNVTITNGAGSITIDASGGGGGSPGGSDTQVQYNSSGSFAGNSNFTFDGTNLTLAGEYISSDFGSGWGTFKGGDGKTGSANGLDGHFFGGSGLAGDGSDAGGNAGHAVIDAGVLGSDGGAGAGSPANVWVGTANAANVYLGGTTTPIIFNNGQGVLFPSSNASGSLTNDGSGNLTWASGGGGSLPLTSPGANSTILLDHTDNYPLIQTDSNENPFLSSFISGSNIEWIGFDNNGYAMIYDDNNGVPLANFDMEYGLQVYNPSGTICASIQRGGQAYLGTSGYQGALTFDSGTGQTIGINCDSSSRLNIGGGIYAGSGFTVDTAGNLVAPSIQSVGGLTAASFGLNVSPQIPQTLTLANVSGTGDDGDINGNFAAIYALLHTFGLAS